MSDAIMVPLADLVRRSGMHRTTIYRWLRKKRINSERRGVLKGELAAKWPELLDTWELAEAKRAARGCPTCGPGTPCRCTVCGRNVA